MDVQWSHSIPIATVYSESTGDIFTINLLHEAYVRRYEIGKGSQLRLSDRRYIRHATPATRGIVAKPSLRDLDRVFDAWFSFRRSFRGVLSNKILRVLFLSGIHTPDDLRRHVHGPMTHLPGIGPATRKKMITLFG